MFNRCIIVSQPFINYIEGQDSIYNKLKESRYIASYREILKLLEIFCDRINCYYLFL